MARSSNRVSAPGPLQSINATDTGVLMRPAVRGALSYSLSCFARPTQATYMMAGATSITFSSVNYRYGHTLSDIHIIVRNEASAHPGGAWAPRVSGNPMTHANQNNAAYQFAHAKSRSRRPSYHDTAYYVILQKPCPRCVPV